MSKKILQQIYYKDNVSKKLPDDRVLTQSRAAAKFIRRILVSDNPGGKIQIFVETTLSMLIFTAVNLRSKAYMTYNPTSFVYAARGTNIVLFVREIQPVISTYEDQYERY
jgi:hypothetical protein